MRARCFEICMAMLLLLAGGAVKAGAGQPPKQETPQPLPKEIVAAWKKAGGGPGWMGMRLPYDLSFGEKATGLAGPVPAFVFQIRRDGLLSKLPNPAEPFGLCLRSQLYSDVDLKGLAGLKSLHTLNLSNTSVSDSGLKYLAGLKSLHRLCLYNTSVTDEGLKDLGALKSLDALLLNSTRVTDKGLKELAGFKSLHTLDLGYTQVTGAGLKELASLTSLHTLGLEATKVTDASLKDLAGLNSLHTLVLLVPEVSDKGLKELADIKSLRTLYLGTKVTDAGVAQLQKALPDCRIHR